MRILVITPYFYPLAGGSQRYIEELYGEVLRQHPGWEVDVLTYNTENVAAVEGYRGMTIYRVRCVELLRGQFALPNYVDVFRLLRRLRNRKYDLVNSHTRFFDNSWWAPLAARYLGAKTLLTDHCAYHPQHPSLLVQFTATVIDHLMIPLLNRMYNRVTVVSEATKHFLKVHGISQDIAVIYGGVNVESYRGKRSNNKEVVVSYVGRLIPAKGPQLVVEAAKKLLPKYPQLRFIFAGEGEMLSTLKVNASKKMQFVGNLSRVEVADLLKKTDIVVLPSTHHEGLPSVILEAGAAGCAVVTTDRGGVKEVVEENKTGVIIQPTSDSLILALEKLIADPELTFSLGKGLQQTVIKKFEWKFIGKKYIHLLSVLTQ